MKQPQRRDRRNKPAQVESGRFPVEDFDHRAHLRLAFVFVLRFGFEGGLQRMRAALAGLLQRAGPEAANKYHETLTQAWMRLVAQSLAQGPAVQDADTWLDGHPQLLDRTLLNRYYSHERLFSPEARLRFVDADLQALPSPD